MQPPYLVGMTCGFCHIGFNPLNPPVDPERPRWSELAGAIGNQYWEEGKLFNLQDDADATSAGIWATASRPARPTRRGSRPTTSTTRATSTRFSRSARGPTAIEKMADGSERAVYHILKDGADSVGVAGASLRVYVNIGMCSDIWLTVIDPVAGLVPQQPFDMARARKECPDWVATEARMPAAEAFLKTIGPMHLADAPGGQAYLARSASAGRARRTGVRRHVRAAVTRASSRRRRSSTPVRAGPGSSRPCSSPTSSTTTSSPTIVATPCGRSARTWRARWPPTRARARCGSSSRPKPTRQQPAVGAITRPAQPQQAATSRSRSTSLAAAAATTARRRSSRCGPPHRICTTTRSACS